MEKVNFRIEYDHRPDEVVDIISAKLSQFGLEIVWIDSENDGFDDYEIKKIQN